MSEEVLPRPGPLQESYRALALLGHPRAISMRRRVSQVPVSNAQWGPLGPSKAPSCPQRGQTRKEGKRAVDSPVTTTSPRGCAHRDLVQAPDSDRAGRGLPQQEGGWCPELRLNSSHG